MKSLGRQISTGHAGQAMRSRARPLWLSIGLLGLLSAAAPTPVLGQSSAPSETAAWHFVAFGDSYPEGAHCPGPCTMFPERYATGIHEMTGRETVFTDFTGSQEPGLPADEHETTASLLTSLRFNAATRDAVRSADIIMITSGSNEIHHALDCDEAVLPDCVEALQRLWLVNYDAILDEIALLRDGAPTAIRLVGNQNDFISDPGLAAAGADVGIDAAMGARIFRHLNEAACDVAADHGAICLDLRPLINGPTMDQPGDSHSETNLQAIADALLATGLPELE
jgi:hypothetical protein